MRHDLDYSELRSYIQRCKRWELDKLIKLTNLPRGGLKPELQQRLISYLGQDPSPRFLALLNDFRLGLQNVAGSSNKPGSNHLPSYFPVTSSVQSLSDPGFQRSRSEPDTDDVNPLCSAESNLYNPHSNPNLICANRQRLKQASGSASSRVSSSLPDTEVSTAAARCMGTECVSPSRGAANGEIQNNKGPTYFLSSAPIGPVITLAGVDGCLRLPASIPGFRFRESPFFKEIDVLQSPQVLTPSRIVFATGRRSYDRSVVLRFTSDQAETITYHCRRLPDERMDFGVQIIMRFARLDPSFCQQLTAAYGLTTNRSSRLQPTHPELHPLPLSDDSLPVHLAIHVNGHPIQLPPLLPSNRPGLDGRRNPRPINITPFLLVSPAMHNYIKITWTHDYSSFVYSLVGIYLMHKRSPQYLCQLLQSVAFKPSDQMKLELIRKLGPCSRESTSAQPYTVSAMTDNQTEDDDDDNDLVMPNTLPVQLLCPLSKCRIEVPVRGRACRHVQCYDATTYLIINERKPSWNCPVCDKKTYYEDLLIDGFFLDVLNSPATQELDEVVFHDDGSWSAAEPTTSQNNSDPGADEAGSGPYESRQTSRLNSPVTLQRTPVLSSEPDSLGSSSMPTTTSCPSFVPSPTGPGDSSNPCALSTFVPNSPTRISYVAASNSSASASECSLVSFAVRNCDRIMKGCNNGNGRFVHHQLTSHNPVMEKDRSQEGVNTTIDLTFSDEEGDKRPSHVSSVNVEQSATIVLSDEDSVVDNSPRIQHPIGRSPMSSPKVTTFKCGSSPAHSCPSVVNEPAASVSSFTQNCEKVDASPILSARPNSDNPPSIRSNPSPVPTSSFLSPARSSGAPCTTSISALSTTDPVRSTSVASVSRPARKRPNPTPASVKNGGDEFRVSSDQPDDRTTSTAQTDTTATLPGTCATTKYGRHEPPMRPSSAQDEQPSQSGNSHNRTLNYPANFDYPTKLLPPEMTFFNTQSSYEYQAPEFYPFSTHQNGQVHFNDHFNATEQITNPSGAPSRRSYYDLRASDALAYPSDRGSQRMTHPGRFTNHYLPPAQSVRYDDPLYCGSDAFEPWVFENPSRFPGSHQFDASYTRGPRRAYYP
ncbi:hypothetical protein EG68_08130 [Paragonimus skrjabini miyazakii]|uniref:Uncharacterized protein n=1 Tax=Paragonimus skrjabini miyazakii TaxID=59628 RepID=A0A8S9YJU1_9TREM|nr:hypothetical protein EG68_08130 [Paragonimus skrjabini miyazakii]